jgi:hypothetical protein
VGSNGKVKGSSVVISGRVVAERKQGILKVKPHMIILYHDIRSYNNLSEDGSYGRNNAQVEIDNVRLKIPSLLTILHDLMTLSGRKLRTARGTRGGTRGGMVRHHRCNSSK